MENRKEFDNSVFISTLTGVMLLIGSIITILVGVSKEYNDTPYFLGAVISGLAAATLLLQAMKKDKRRLA